MPSGGASVVVAAPPQIVWDLIADPARHTDFGTYVSQVTVVTPGPIGLGTVYTETSGPRGLRSQSEWRITTFEPPQRLVHEGREPAMRSVFTWTLEPLGADSTRLSQHGVYVMFPGFRPLGWLLETLVARRMLRRESDRMLLDMKRLAEAAWISRP